jgi:membrane protein implicated in regulation of membrane protease activity
MLLLIALLLAILAFPTFMAMLGIITLAGTGYVLLALLLTMGVSLLLAPLLCSDVRTHKRRVRERQARQARLAEHRRQEFAELHRQAQERIRLD